MVNLVSLWKPEVCGQTVLPDRSILIEQKLVENVKIKRFKWDIFGNFQTMWFSQGQNLDIYWIKTFVDDLFSWDKQVKDRKNGNFFVYMGWSIF